MEVTKQNIESIRSELAFEIIFMKEKYTDILNEEYMQKLDEEIDNKIAKMLPSYKGNVLASDAFGDILERTIDNFAKKLM